MPSIYRTLITDRPYYARYAGPYVADISRTEEEIRLEVMDNLALDSWVDATKIDVDVTGTVVTLSGTVDSFVEKRSAGDDAADVIGVTDVINNITVAV